VTDEKTYLFAVTKPKAEAEIQVYTLPIKRAELAKQIESFRQQLATRDLAFRASAGKLYELLLKPAQVQLRSKTNVVIAPDSNLWDLAFHDRRRVDQLRTVFNRVARDEQTADGPACDARAREPFGARESRPGSGDSSIRNDIACRQS